MMNWCWCGWSLATHTRTPHACTTHARTTHARTHAQPTHSQPTHTLTHVWWLAGRRVTLHTRYFLLIVPQWVTSTFRPADRDGHHGITSKYKKIAHATCAKLHNKNSVLYFNIHRRCTWRQTKKRDDKTHTNIKTNIHTQTHHRYTHKLQIHTDTQTCSSDLWSP